jgi:hypothetical protein
VSVCVCGCVCRHLGELLSARQQVDQPLGLLTDVDSLILARRGLRVLKGFEVFELVDVLARLFHEPLRFRVWGLGVGYRVPGTHIHRGSRASTNRFVPFFAQYSITFIAWSEKGSAFRGWGLGVG